MLTSLYPFIALLKKERRATAQNAELVLSMVAFYVWIMYRVLVFPSKHISVATDLYVFPWIISVASVMQVATLLVSLCSLRDGLTMPLFFSNMALDGVYISLSEWSCPDGFIGLLVTDFAQSDSLNQLTASYITGFFVVFCFCEITAVTLCIFERVWCAVQERTAKEK